MRHMYLLLGCFFFSVGVVALLIPVLPTTPFMIIALWAFSRSSDRFHQWLYHHRLFGPPLQKWHEYRVIPLFAKTIAIFFMLVSLVYLLVFSGIDTWITVCAGLLMLAAAIYILSKPSNVPHSTDINSKV